MNPLQQHSKSVLLRGVCKFYCAGKDIGDVKVVVCGCGAAGFT
jgi:malic enzyme